VRTALAVLAAAEEETEGIRRKEEFFLPGSHATAARQVQPAREMIEVLLACLVRCLRMCNCDRWRVMNE